MPKKYDPKIKGAYSKHNYDNMKEALKCVKTGVLSIRKAAEKYGIKRSTLADRVSGKTDVMGSSGRNPVLPNEIENLIADKASKMSTKGLGISRKKLLHRIGLLCKKNKLAGFKNGYQPSKHVWYGIKRRCHMSLRIPEKLGTVRARGLNPVVVGNYFKDLKSLYDTLHVEKDQIWNCDETGKQMEHTPTKVVARKGSKSVVGRTGNDRTNVTIMACGNAAGDKMPPMLIVKGKTNRCLFGFNTADGPDNAIWTYSGKAWMTEDLGEKWFRDVFLANCGPKRPQLLILDGHGSHESLELLTLAEQEDIHILCFPPHTTHYLQPMDRSVFGPFNKAYNAACSEFLSAAPCNMINKWTFPKMFKYAWDNGVTKKNIISGFKATGIFPFNSNVLPDSAYAPSSVYDRPLDTGVHPSNTVVQLSSTVIQPSSTVVHVQPSSTVVHEQPSSTVVHVHPSSAVIQPSSAVIQPSSTVIQPSITDVQPSSTVVQPSSTIVQPSSTAIHPYTATEPASVVDIDLSIVRQEPLSDDEVDRAIASILDPNEPPALDMTYAPAPVFIDDPIRLLDMINKGEIDIVCDETESYTNVGDGSNINSGDGSENKENASPSGKIDMTTWNSDIEMMFSPHVDNQPKNQVIRPPSRAITGHRLLTHASIIQMKSDARNKKQNQLKLVQERRDKAAKRKIDIANKKAAAMQKKAAKLSKK